MMFFNLILYFLNCSKRVLKYLSFSRITLRGLGKSVSSFVLHYLIHKASLEVKEVCSKKERRKRSYVVRNGNAFFQKSFWALRWAVSHLPDRHQGPHTLLSLSAFSTCGAAALSWVAMLSLALQVRNDPAWHISAQKQLTEAMLLGNSAHISDCVCALSRLQFERNSYLGVSCYIFLRVLAETLQQIVYHFR